MNWVTQTEKQVDVLSGKLGQIEALALYADGKDCYK